MTPQVAVDMKDMKDEPVHPTMPVIDFRHTGFKQKNLDKSPIEQCTTIENTQIVNIFLIQTKMCLN